MKKLIQKIKDFFIYQGLWIWYTDLAKFIYSTVISFIILTISSNVETMIWFWIGIPFYAIAIFYILKLFYYALKNTYNDIFGKNQ